MNYIFNSVAYLGDKSLIGEFLIALARQFFSWCFGIILGDKKRGLANDCGARNKTHTGSVV